MKPALPLSASVLAIALLLSGCQSTGDSPPEKSDLSPEQIQERRTKIMGMAKMARERLQAETPDVKREIEQAAGYGVFDVTTVNAVLLVGARGAGVVVDNKTSKPTFMRALRAGTGPGVGYQQTYQIFVFKTPSAMKQFTLGGDVGGDVSASVTAGTSGKQYSFNPSITVYQVNESGFAIQANWGGTGYVLDPDLN